MPRYVQPPYPAYFSFYYQNLPDNGTPYELLTKQLTSEFGYLESLPEGVKDHTYAPEKWTVAEVLGHILDAERVFAYRALCIARGEQQELPGFDENAYVRAGLFNRRTLAGLNEELLAARKAHLVFVRHLQGEDMDKVGSANGSPVSINALLLVMAAHLRHHVGILKERYGV